MRESKYQSDIIKTLTEMFPGCVLLRNDPQYTQGVPDLIILYGNKWAMLEIKANPGAHRQPNQEYYIDLLDRMSFAAFLCPETEEEVLLDLQRAFRPARLPRLPIA